MEEWENLEKVSMRRYKRFGWALVRAVRSPLACLQAPGALSEEAKLQLRGAVADV